MAKLYLLGGEDVEKRESPEINKLAFKDAGKSPQILIFPWTGPTVSKSDKFRKITKDYLLDLGARSVDFAEVTDSLATIKSKILSTDLIYLPGGDTEILLKRLKRYSKIIGEYNGIIVGNSAGAMVLCKNSWGGKNLKGFNLVNINIMVHYGSKKFKFMNKENTLKFAESIKEDVYAIPEKSALVISGKMISPIGKVYKFSKGKVSKLE